MVRGHLICVICCHLTPYIGTPATTSQMAKDVVTFLSWAAEPEHDERKQYGLKAVIILSALTAISIYVKRFKWAPIKARKIGTNPTPPVICKMLKFCSSVQPAGRQEGSLELDLVLVILRFSANISALNQACHMS